MWSYQLSGPNRQDSTENSSNIAVLHSSMKLDLSPMCKSNFKILMYEAPNGDKSVLKSVANSIYHLPLTEYLQLQL